MISIFLDKKLENRAKEEVRKGQVSPAWDGEVLKKC